MSLVTHVKDHSANSHRRSVMRHITHVNESCHACEWAISHMRMSHVTHVKNHSTNSHRRSVIRHVTHVNESYPSCERVISHMWMRHVAHMKTTTQRAIVAPSQPPPLSPPYMWMGHVIRMNTSRHTYKWFSYRRTLSHHHSHTTPPLSRRTSHTTPSLSHHTTYSKPVTPHPPPHHPCEWVPSQIWNTSRHIYKWVSYPSRHIQTRHVTCINESAKTLEWVMSRVCMSVATLRNASRHT